MVDDLVREENPAVAGNDFHQVLLDFTGSVCSGEIEAARYALDMGIDDDSGGNVVGGAEDHVGGFARGAGYGISSSSVCGTLPPNSFTIFFAAPITDFALLLKKPVERMSLARTS